MSYSLARMLIIGQCAAAARRVAGVDYGLVCCEISPESDNTWPQLTRVDFDRRAMGRRAARMLLGMLDPDRGEIESELLTGELIRGTTSNRPGQTAPRAAVVP